MFNKKILAAVCALILAANSYSAPKLQGVKIGYAHCCVATISYCKSFGHLTSQ